MRGRFGSEGFKKEKKETKIRRQSKSLMVKPVGGRKTREFHRETALSERGAKRGGTVIKYKDPLAADGEIFKGPVDPQTVEHQEVDLKSADVPSVEPKESVL